MTAGAFLRTLQRFDLAALIDQCDVQIIETQIDNGFYHDLINEAVVKAPAPINGALNVLPSHDRKRLAEAIASIYPDVKSPDDIRVELSHQQNARGTVGMLADLIIHRAMMISVATGGDRIQEVDDYYRSREHSIRERMPDGISYENPFASLWDWYKFWSNNLPTYRDRRSHIYGIFSPVINAISKRSTVQVVHRELVITQGVQTRVRALKSDRGQTSWMCFRP